MDKMNGEMENMEGELENAQGEMMNPEMKTMLEDYKSMQSNMKEMEGKMMAMKDQLEEAMGMSTPEAIENAAEMMNEDREEASKMMNAAGLDPKEIVKLSGDPLKAATVNAIRVSNGRPLLSEDHAKDSSFLNGIYSAMKDMAPATKVPAHLKQADTQEQTRILNSRAVISGNKANINTLYGKKEA